MLKKRIMTALILLPIVILGIIYLPVLGFGIITAVLIAIGAWEWANLSELNRLWHKVSYVIGTLLLLCIPVIQSYYLLGIAVLVWFFNSIWICAYPAGTRFWQSHILLRLLMGWGVLIPCWVGLLLLRQQPNGIYLIFLTLVIVWCADSGAYFTGRFFGKKPLAPQVSPNKTQEGVYGGLLCALLVTLALGWFWLGTKLALPLFALLVLIAAIFSVIGDLFESMVKRMANVKDSGVLFPGHGGMLDRIDSLTAVAPVFALGILFIQG